MKTYLYNQHRKVEKNQFIKLNSFSISIICFVFLYALFALDRIKMLFSFEIENIGTTNELWLVPLLSLIVFIKNGYKQSIFIDKYSKLMAFLIFCLIFVIAIGGFFATSVEQYLYAGLLFIVPMQMFFLMSKSQVDYVDFFIKSFVIVCLIYALFAIILSTNYGYFMSLLGNELNYEYNSQYRASMMIGSSITVSYYFNITLPFCIYMFYRSSDKKWKSISLIATVVNLAATFILLSRAASICAILIIIAYFLFIANKSKFIFKKYLLVMVLMIGSYFVFQNYDLSRIIKGLNFSGDSVMERFNAGNLAFHIFSNYPLIGSGVGRYFERVYSDRYINVDGMVGLIDPHNMYLLILSEMGILGLIIITALFILLFRNFSHIKEKTLRRTAYMTIIAFLINSFGGSHLLNEISYSIVFWTYMGLFCVISRRDRRVFIKKEKVWEKHG